MNPKHDLFIAEYLKTGSATRAAIAAGYSPRSASSSGSRLLADEAISAEIAKRQNVVAEETKNDLASLLRQAEVALGVAEKANNAAAMVSAIQFKARLLGLLNDKQEPQADGISASLQANEFKTVARLMGEAAESLGLPREATPAMIVGALAGRALPTPEAFVLLHAQAKEAANV